MQDVALGAIVMMLVGLAGMTLYIAGVLLHDAALDAWDDLQARREAREAEREAALHRRPKRDLRRRG